MKKKSLRKGIAGAAVALACAGAPLVGGGLLTGCGEGPGNNYNIIAADASIPPVIAALESIKNGDDTYAYIVRGKTYAGIENVSQFHNLGFKTTDNYNGSDTLAMYSAISRAVQQIQRKDNRAKFTIYCRDYSAPSVYAMALRSNLTDDQFEIVMVEDGSGAYTSVYDYYVKNVVAKEGVDDPGYKNYQDKIASCQAMLKTIKDSAGEIGYQNTNFENPLALASCKPFSYLMQSKTNLKNQLDKNEVLKDSKLYQVLGLEDCEEGVVAANIKYKSISEYVSSLTETQKNDYLTLMFGNDRAITDELFSRTQVGDTEVPGKKLVYIGNRVKQGNIVSTGKIENLSELKADYDQLDEKLKEVFLNAEDYKIVYDQVNSNAYSSLPDEAKLAAVNTYLNYVYGLKLTQRLYGDEYDILFKGHPSEVVGNYAAWIVTDYQYTPAGEDAEPITYKDLIFNMVQDFYSKDSEGKLIGILPGAVAAENFAYLGYEFALGGLSSSTYSGYDPDVIVEFLLLNGKATLDDDNTLKTRYDEGTLTWTKDEDAEYTTTILNQGNVYKAFAEMYEKENDTTLQEKYEGLLKNWLKENGTDITDGNVDQYTVDTYGHIVQKQH